MSGTSVPMYYCMLTQIQATFVPSLAEYAPSYLNSSGIYYYIPVGQLQDFQYSSIGNAETIDSSTGARVKSEACLATVYAMLARIIGQIHPAALIINQYKNEPPNFCNASQHAYGVQIDCLLQQSTYLAFWPSSLQSPVNYATFTPNGAGKRLPLKTAEDDSAAEQQIEAGHPLILHATVQQAGGGTTDHFMLATSLYKAVAGDGTGLSPGTVTRLVVNDPEIGGQLFIDMNPNDRGSYHFAVLSPGGPGDQNSYKALTAFAFKADSYKYVTLQ